MSAMTVVLLVIAAIDCVMIYGAVRASRSGRGERERRQ